MPESTINCSFWKLLSKNLDQKEKVIFFKTINEFVDTISPLVRDASLLANYILLQQCESTNRSEPFNIYLNDEHRLQQFYSHCLKKVSGEIVGTKEKSNHKSTETKLEKCKKEKKTLLLLLKKNPKDKKLKIKFKAKSEEIKELKLKFKNQKKRIQSSTYINELKWNLPTFPQQYKFKFNQCNRIYDVLSKEMMVNSKNHLILNFEKRQLKFFLCHYDRNLAYKIVKLINYPFSEHKKLFLEWKSEFKILSQKISELTSNNLGKKISDCSTFDHKQNQTKSKFKYEKKEKNFQFEMDSKEEEEEEKEEEKEEKEEEEEEKEEEEEEKEEEEEEEDKSEKENSIKIIKKQKDLLEKKNSKYYEFVLLKSKFLKEVIKNHRAVVRGYQDDLRNEYVNEEYCEKHFEFLIKYYYLLQCEAVKEAKKAKETKIKSKLPTFTLVPIHHYRRICLGLDSRLLKEITNKIKTKIDKNLIDDPWMYWFDVDRAVRKQKHSYFQNYLKTDGVKACILFDNTPHQPRKKKKKPKTSKKRKRKRKTTKKTEDKKEEKQEPKVELLNVKKGLFKDYEIKLDVKTLESKQNMVLQIISVDPGRWKVASVYDNLTNEYREMGKKEYYDLRGTKKAAKKREKKWENFLTSHPKLKEVWIEVQSFKVSSSEEFLAAWKKRNEIEKTIWEFYLKKYHSYDQFQSYKRKQRTQEILTRRILGSDMGKHPNIKTIVAFGNGKFPTSAQGHAATPLQSVSKHLSHYVPVIMTDECNTSKICPKCKNKSLELATLPSYVRQKKYNIVVDLQEKQIWKEKLYELKTQKCFHLLACTNKCSKTWITDRDKIGSYNIYYCMFHLLYYGIRPEIFKKKSKKSEH